VLARYKYSMVSLCVLIEAELVAARFQCLFEPRKTLGFQSCPIFLHNITAEIRRPPVACPIRLSSAMLRFLPHQMLVPPHLFTIYLPTLFLLHLLDLAYCLAP